jgi:thiol-disulfide isomerase/thioredoxin
MLTYQVTTQVSIAATIPFLYASRRQQSQYATLYTSGIGDVSLGAQYWLRNPKSEKAGTNNIQIGLSLLMPTGDSRQSNVVATTYGGSTSTQYPDYSVQPGGGSWGMIMSGQAFQALGNNMVAFVDGDYVMSQGGYHNFWTSHGGTSNNPPSPTPGMTQFDAIQDQYMVEVGASHPAPGIKGLGLTFAFRAEGVPARNLIGNDLGFRRPGFGLALTPGFIYTHGNHMLQFSVGKLIIRDRTKSVPEKINGVHEGDAAFADYVWMAGYTLRLPARKSRAEEPAQNPLQDLSGGAHSAPAAVAASGASAKVESGTGTFKPFTLKTMDGKKRTLQDFANKLTLVNFFFPRCPFCNVELPEIQKIYDKYKGKGLSVVWINILPDEVGLIAGWQMAKNLTVPVLIGGSQDALQRDYRIESTPSTYLLGEHGEVLFHKDGYAPGDENILEAKIAAALNAVSGTPNLAPAPACPEPANGQAAVPAVPLFMNRPRD